jgi:hypothetical protein
MPYGRRYRLKVVSPVVDKQREVLRRLIAHAWEENQKG